MAIDPRRYDGAHQKMLVPAADAMAAGLRAFRLWEEETSYRGGSDASEGDAELLVAWVYEALSSAESWSSTKSESSFDRESDVLKRLSKERSRKFLFIVMES